MKIKDFMTRDPDRLDEALKDFTTVKSHDPALRTMTEPGIR